jgi:hypothetical protein
MNPDLNLEVMADALDVPVDNLAAMTRDEFMALVNRRREEATRRALYLTAQELAIEEYFGQEEGAE